MIHARVGGGKGIFRARVVERVADFGGSRRAPCGDCSRSRQPKSFSSHDAALEPWAETDIGEYGRFLNVL